LFTFFSIIFSLFSQNYNRKRRPGSKCIKFCELL
jgi:hypothetical protein